MLEMTDISSVTRMLQVENTPRIIEDIIMIQMMGMQLICYVYCPDDRHLMDKLHRMFQLCQTQRKLYKK